MTQQLNNQLFAFTKQFTDSAFKAQSLALKGLETVAELQLKALEEQAKVSAEFVAEAMEARRQADELKARMPAPAPAAPAPQGDQL